jgi:hypothetical protein
MREVSCTKKSGKPLWLRVNTNYPDKQSAALHNSGKPLYSRKHMNKSETPIHNARAANRYTT